MTVSISCNDDALPSLSHRTVLAMILHLGFTGVDIGMFAEATHVTLSSGRSDPVRRATEVRANVEAAGLDVADVFLTSSMQLHRLTPTSRHAGDIAELNEIFAATAEFAAALDARGITLLRGVIAEGQSLDEALDCAAEGLAPVVRMGAKRGLAVSVEQHFGSCIETPRATSQLVARC